MSRILAFGLIAVVALALAAGCGSPEATENPATTPRDVTPAATTASTDLEALREAADLAPCPAPAGDSSIARDLPAIELACLAGGPDVEVAGLVGTPYVVNFWASDCAPCKEEGPYLQAVYEAAEGKVGVLGVNILDPYGNAGALAGAREFGMRFPILFDPDGLLGETFQVPALPATFFVDADGAIVGEPRFGAFESADELKSAIQQELGVHL
jgi:thiol-disulfide isomerase/thioredoxin